MLGKRNQCHLLDVLMLALVIGIELLPNMTAGLQCYNCDGEECEKHYKGETVECEGYCWSSVDRGIQARRSCGNPLKGLCVNTNVTFPVTDSGCYNKTKLAESEIEECMSLRRNYTSNDVERESGNERALGPGYGTMRTCFCNKDLCNGGFDYSDKPEITDTNGGLPTLCFGILGLNTVFPLFVILGVGYTGSLIPRI